MRESILLYRFMNAESALKSIEARQFRVGRIPEFNDPFEWRMGITGIIDGAETVARSLVDSSIMDLNSRFGILCMSDTVEEPVLWSHYADSHYGVAFEVDYLFEEGAIHKMIYADDRPFIDANKLHDTEHLKAAVEGMILQKSLGWAYEREYRVHIDLATCSISGGHYFQSIPEDFLTRVVLGHRCPLEEHYVAKALEKVGLSDTLVTRARMDETSYKVRS